jgi:uncharacterized protein (DUF1778 family)
MAAKRRKKVTKDKSVQVRVTDEQKAILSKAAERSGLGLSSWLLMLGLREADADRK